MLGRKCVATWMQQPTVVKKHELHVGMQQQRREQEAQVRR
jgi:hypothetical protein